MRVVDLFSGAGGLTFGFNYKVNDNTFSQNDEFDILFANEINYEASSAFALNFPEVPLFQTSIEDLSADFFRENDIDITDVDLVIGGPPCQSYSTVGLRQYDERAVMYREYRRLLTIIQPKLFLFENVTGLLSMRNETGDPVINDITASFSNFDDFDIELGYKIHSKVLNAQNFGVPQSRERVFLVGIRTDLHVEVDWQFPESLLHNEADFLTLEDAIGDLPPLQNGEETAQYTLPPYRDYQNLMRGNTDRITHHVNANNGERMLQIMASVIPGEGRPYINNLVETGQLPPELYLTSGYANTYGKLWWDRPCTTITNNMCTPSALRCIHPLQNRALTPREGARIQSFPDFFQFCGSKASVTTQIGNAVPPLLAIALAERLHEFFIENGWVNL